MEGKTPRVVGDPHEAKETPPTVDDKRRATETMRELSEGGAEGGRRGGLGSAEQEGHQPPLARHHLRVRRGNTDEPCSCDLLRLGRPRA
jgi:hypothetical protein